MIESGHQAYSEVRSTQRSWVNTTLEGTYHKFSKNYLRDGLMNNEWLLQKRFENTNYYKNINA